MAAARGRGAIGAGILPQGGDPAGAHAGAAAGPGASPSGRSGWPLGLQAGSSPSSAGERLGPLAAFALPLAPAASHSSSVSSTSRALLPTCGPTTPWSHIMSISREARV